MSRFDTARARQVAVITTGTPVAQEYGLTLAVKRAQAALTATLADPDDVEGVTDALRALTDVTDALSRTRDDRVVELVRGGIAQSMVAAMTGLSRQRVSQLMARNVDVREQDRALEVSRVASLGGKASARKRKLRAMDPGDLTALAEQSRATLAAVAH